MNENPDLEALEWVLSQVVHHGIPTGISDIEYGDNLDKLNRVQALIERVKATEPMKQVYRVMQEQGCFVVMEVTRQSLAEDLEIPEHKLPSNEDIDEIVGQVAEGNGTYTEIILEGIREVLREKLGLNDL
ncbi:hypothetical protein [Roseococcus pinisoli]|uniref:Uncharacterized protein n=1 Tax=Roseococcus pinisoli TaxID=2835040 RepID=A0ABS5QFQ2_9PROT|nr:hypothetical protein [Roseococcus pinisoli]MBS7812387.1 hypothetical protein [Roseococcus pinisoli]